MSLRYRAGVVARPGARPVLLLANLGTPAAPTAGAVRRYLAQFLHDWRVVELTRWLWCPLLHFIILPVRSGKVAKKYAGIWTPKGSPLLALSQELAAAVQAQAPEFEVRLGMRYGEPSLASQLRAAHDAGASRVLVLPLYPQYAASTTGSTIDAVQAWARRTRRVPELRVVNQFHDDPGTIDALASRVRDHWMREGRGRMLVMSFHGLPARTLALGDPYHCQCLKTARLLADRLGLSPPQYEVAFQSRFGRARWLEPYTDATLRKLAQQGHERVDVICPGFAADCLETLEEIGIEGRNTFIAAGGKEFHLIPCLNDSPAWIDALAQLAMRHLQGWPTQPESADDLQQRRDRALAVGARR